MTRYTNNAVNNIHTDQKNIVFIMIEYKQLGTVLLRPHAA